MIQLILILLLVAILDVYTFQAFRTASRQSWVRWTFWGVHALLYAGMAVIVINGRDTPRWFFTYFFSIWVAFYLPKLFIVLLLLVEDLGRLGSWIGQRFKAPASMAEASLPSAASSEIPASPAPEQEQRRISRSKFISQLSLGVASLPFVGTLYGITWGKYNYHLRRITIPIRNLPAAFEGLRITQVSDIHTGSFDNKLAVQRGFELINEQASDLIFFTGDLVNTYIDEVEGYEDIYASLSAPKGVFSVLGNHDYGNYSQWDSPEAKEDHFQRVIDKHGELGWKLLRNEHHLLREGEDELAILGVENWGKLRRFPKKGDVAQALKGAEQAKVKLLLSHDPSHWDAKVRPEFSDIDVTFSGHTHGFQMGVEIPGFRWSPAQYMYPQWAGLYREAEQYLYVNRGFGYLGFAGRIGIWPEITVITLTRG